jgi:hypothetical protein
MRRVERPFSITYYCERCQIEHRMPYVYTKRDGRTDVYMRLECGARTEVKRGKK